jgi:hypothetical protein
MGGLPSSEFELRGHINRLITIGKHKAAIKGFAGGYRRQSRRNQDILGIVKAPDLAIS